MDEHRTRTCFCLIKSHMTEVLATISLAGPTTQQIDAGVKWALRQRDSGRPVLVHCAHGHGRSLVLMCAILVVSGRAGDFLEAYRMVKAARPRVRLNNSQHASLVRWQEHMKPRRKAA